jgi:tetratricopeptide (TPR) repeat protein
MGAWRGRVNFLVAIALAAVAGQAASPPRAAHAQAVKARVSTPEIPKDMPPGFVVAPFENPGKLPTIEWMRVGLAVAVAEKLEAVPALRPLGGELFIPLGGGPATLDAAGLAAWAPARRARFVFTGAVARTDWKLDFTLMVWKLDGDGDARTAMQIASWHKVDDFGHAFDMLNAGLGELCGKAGIALSDDAKKELARAPTSDFYAFTLYGRGVYNMHALNRLPDLATAQKALERAVFIDPKFAEAHYMLAMLYARQKQPAKARGKLNYALDLRPDYYAPIAALAKDAAAEKQRDEAMDLATRALSIRPWDLDMRLLLGSLLWDDGDVDGAGVELERLVKVDPDNLPARRLLVLVHATKGEGDKLVAELEQIVRLDPKDQAAKLDLGAAYAAIGRDDDAIAVYKQIVAENPKQLQALKFLGDIYKKRGDLSGAIAWYEQALKANRKDPRPYFLLGAAYVEGGLYKKAIRIYEAAQEFPEYLADAEANLGAIYLKLGDDGQALWYLKRAAAKRPADPKVHYDYGLVLMRTKKYDDALAELRRAAELDPKDADVQFAIGVAYLRLGKIEDAEKAFKACLEIDPNHADAKHNLQLIDDLRRRAREGEVVVE